MQHTLNIDRESSNQIKGIAILMIMMYNFLQNMIPYGGNEMAWDYHNTMTFFSGLGTKFFSLCIFSYYGWYGVPLFLFLSGYGLSMKYQGPIDFIPFSKKHFKKLFILLFPALLLYIATTYYLYHKTYPPLLFFEQITFSVNIFSREIEPGTYWFFGLILQFYILFSCFLQKIEEKTLLFFLIGSILLDYSIMYLLEPEQCIYAKHNFIGWSAPFIYGILRQRYRRERLELWTLIPMCLLFIPCSLQKFLQPFSSILFIEICVTIFTYVKSRLLIFLGSISSCIFVIHPIIRFVFMRSTPEMRVYNRILLYIPIVIVLSYIYRYLYNKLLSRT